MDKQNPIADETAPPIQDKKAWIPPSVSRFRSGEAEASDLNTTDGPFIS